MEDVKAKLRTIGNLENLFGDPNVGRRIRSALDAMEIADNLCRQNGNPPGLFLALQPSEILGSCLGKLYEPHAKELVRRCLAGEGLEPATDAEILAGLSATSLQSPLRSESMLLFEHLFKLVTGEPLEEEFGRESYEGQLQEVLADARTKLAVPGRGKTEPTKATRRRKKG